MKETIKGVYKKEIKEVSKQTQNKKRKRNVGRKERMKKIYIKGENEGTQEGGMNNLWKDVKKE